ncbi:MAG TPA: sulfotransferase domain-containing protein [Planctomycetaceae bacterium]|nr:sulfotransferase domain-containing protein [Planctomycetaceae bacterium]
MSRWPDFFLVGAAKSGTTTLFHHLKDHPSVFMPNLKEPWFFSFHGAPDGHLCARDKGTIIRDAERYLGLFERARPHQITGEASPIYLYFYRRTVANMARLIDGHRRRRILIILRNPVDRAVSHYRMLRQNGTERRPLAEAMRSSPSHGLVRRCPLFDYVAVGRYARQVEHYLENFDRVAVYLMDDLEADPAGLMRQVYEFLGVDVAFTPDLRRVYNTSRVRNGVEYRSGRAARLVRLMPHVYGEHRTWFGYVRSLLWQAKENCTARRGDPSPASTAEDEELQAASCRGFAEFYTEYARDIERLEALIGRDLSRWQVCRVCGRNKIASGPNSAAIPRATSAHELVGR